MSALQVVGGAILVGMVGTGIFYIMTAPTFSKASKPKVKSAADHDKEIWDKRRSFAEESGERYFSQYLADDGFWEEGRSFKSLAAAKKDARHVLKTDEGETLKVRIYDFSTKKFIATIGA